MLANPSPRIDEVEGRPVLVLEGAPDGVVVVDHHRIVDPHLLHGTTNVVDVAFEWELGSVHADHDELWPVLLRPGADIRKRAQPVDAGIGPEVDEHDFPGEAGRRQARRIDPLGGTADGGQLARRAVVRLLSNMPRCAAAIVIAALPRNRRRSWSIASATSFRSNRIRPDSTVSRRRNVAAQLVSQPSEPWVHIRPDSRRQRLSDEGIDNTFDRSARKSAEPIPWSDGRWRVTRASFVAVRIRLSATERGGGKARRLAAKVA